MVSNSIPSMIAITGQGDTISQLNLLCLSTTSSSSTEHAPQTKVRKVEGGNKSNPGSEAPLT